jgi:hypothetical protein
MNAVEFEKYRVKVEVCRKSTNHFRGIYRIYPNSIKKNRRMSTCHQLDLQTLGSQPIMFKNLANHRHRERGRGIEIAYECTSCSSNIKVLK